MAIGLAARRITVFIATAIVLAGCANGLLRGGGVPPSVVHGGDGFFVSEAQERAIGRRAHPQLVSAYGGVYNNPQVDAMVERIVERLSQASDRNRRYKVTILNAPRVNAFALPGGYLYVTRGMVALANTESELAAVLAHEMAHVIARHAIRRQQEIEATIAATAAVAAPNTDQTIRAATVDSARSYIARFSQQQELEADTIGLKIAANAGYDPLSAAVILSAMSKKSSLRAKRFFAEFDPNASEFLSTHPAPPERLAAILSESRALGYASPVNDPVARATYIQSISGMLYSDDKVEGFVRGRRYIHPGLALTFTVPPGYRIDNRPDAVNAIAADGSVMRFDGEPIEPNGTLRGYLEAVWSDGVNVTDIQDLTINGMRALSARASSSGWEFRLFVFRWSQDRVFRMLFATRSINNLKDAAFLEAAQTVRRLAGDELARAKPLRLSAHQVRPGDTIQSLARTLPEEDNKEERFRVLNGLGDGQPLRPNMWVKVVSD